PLAAPAAYLRDALKKGYAGLPTSADPAAAAPAAAVPAVPAPAAAPKVQASVQAIRDEWERDRARAAEERFQHAGQEQRAAWQRDFEAAQLDGLLAPIAQAWRRDGPASRIAAPLFYRWLARQDGSTAPGEGELLAFAIRKGMLTLG